MPSTPTTTDQLFDALEESLNILRAFHYNDKLHGRAGCPGEASCASYSAQVVRKAYAALDAARAEVFNDRPPLGLGADGRTHSDPYCATLAPMGSPESRWGEICDMCAKRQPYAD